MATRQAHHLEYVGSSPTPVHKEVPVPPYIHTQTHICDPVHIL